MGLKKGVYSQRTPKFHHIHITSQQLRFFGVSFSVWRKEVNTVNWLVASILHDKLLRESTVRSVSDDFSLCLTYTVWGGPSVFFKCHRHSVHRLCLVFSVGSQLPEGGRHDRLTSKSVKKSLKISFYLAKEGVENFADFRLKCACESIPGNGSPSPRPSLKNPQSWFPIMANIPSGIPFALSETFQYVVLGVIGVLNDADLS